MPDCSEFSAQHVEWHRASSITGFKSSPPKIVPQFQFPWSSVSVSPSSVLVSGLCQSLGVTGDQACSAAGDDVLGDDLECSGGVCAPSIFFPSFTVSAIGVDPERAQGTGGLTPFSALAPPGMLSAICKCGSMLLLGSKPG